MPIMSIEGWTADGERALPSGLVHQSRIIDHTPMVADCSAPRLWPLLAPLAARLRRTNGRRGWWRALFRAPSPGSLNRIKDSWIDSLGP
jgi:hypothetical protein